MFGKYSNLKVSALLSKYKKIMRTTLLVRPTDECTLNRISKIIKRISCRYS